MDRCCAVMHHPRMDLCHLICIPCFLSVVSFLERVIGDSERIIEVLQRWGQQRAEVRFFLRHDRAPGHDTGEKENESEREVNRKGVLSKVTECVWVILQNWWHFCLSHYCVNTHFTFIMRMHSWPVPTCVYNTCIFPCYASKCTIFYIYFLDGIMFFIKHALFV